MSVNKVILIGNLGKDPEARNTNGGSAVCNFSLATSERVKDRDGNWSDRTEWHNVVCFGKTAENVAKYCKKGKSVYIEGKLQTRKWQDKDGRDRWTTEVVAFDVRFLGPRAEGGGGGALGGYGGSSDGGGYSAPADGYGGGSGDDEGLPF